MIVKYKTMTWEVHKCSLDKWINTSLNDNGFYQNITDEAELFSAQGNKMIPFDAVIWGNKDSLFCMDGDQEDEDGYPFVAYYVGYLK